MRHLILFALVIISNHSFAQKWDKVGNGIGYFVASHAIFNNELYVGAENYGVGWTTGEILVFRNNQWQNVGSPPTLGLRLLRVINDELYVVHYSFDYSSGKYESFIHVLNNNKWDKITGIDGNIDKIIEYNGTMHVLVTGLKDDPLGADSYIAKWTGNDWLRIGEFEGEASDLVVWNNKIVVAGYFGKVNKITANNLAIWDGQNWSKMQHKFDLRKGFSSYVQIEMYNEKLFITDEFIIGYNGVEMKKSPIYVYENGDWKDCELMSTDDSHILSIANGNLFAVPKISKGRKVHVYNKFGWQNVAVDHNSIDTMLTVESFVFNDEFYVVGDIYENGGKQIGIAKVSIPMGTTAYPNQMEISLYPNPAKNLLSIDLGALELSKMDITDINGKSISVEVENINSINVESLKPGVYFIEITDSKGNLSMKRFIKS